MANITELLTERKQILNQFKSIHCGLIKIREKNGKAAIRPSFVPHPLPLSVFSNSL